MADKAMNEFNSATTAVMVYGEDSNGNQVKVNPNNLIKRRVVYGTASPSQSVTIAANYGALITVYYAYSKQASLFIRTGETTVAKIAGTLSSNITVTASGNNVVVKSTSGNYGITVTVMDAYN